MSIQRRTHGPTGRSSSGLSRLVAGFALLVAILGVSEADNISTGHATERRFPPLRVPPGFKATLFACDPLIEYPSVIALGSRPRTLFVAHDYVTGLGIEIVRRDEVRLIDDTDADGYADRSTVFATGFNSIQGLAYDGGTVFVMHSPFLTSLRDTNSDGIADERRDLLSGLGLAPEENDTRLHCANGVTVGHDRWLYLSLGDHGCDVPRPEGDRLVLQGGGILRCRRDGRDLHIFATGLRNIYDVALDDELNVFVRDNENDGGTYKNRVCQSFFGADHGYPYLYEERPEEALPPLASLGLGSSAGGTCYLHHAFPKEYQGNLFFCEWGRALMRYPRERAAGSSFAPMKEIEFASAAANDPYGFKPTDVIVDRDGSLLVSDWGDGQRPKRGRGRIYRIEYPQTDAPKPDPESIERVKSQQHFESTRGASISQSPDLKTAGPHGRMQAVWSMAQALDKNTKDTLLDLARHDTDTRVRVQAVRALADRGDPVLVHHRLDAMDGDKVLASKLAALGETAPRPMLLEIIVALGRLRWPETAFWLKQHLREPDAALSHAAMQALRRSQNWPAVVALLNEPDASPLRAIALRALAGQMDATVVHGLQHRLQSDPNPTHRTQYADALARICRKPGPWVYWNYRPAPRPANPVAWEQTPSIESSLNRALTDADRGVRLATLRRMQREQIPAQLGALAGWLQTERDPGSVAIIIECLRDKPPESIRDLCESVIRDPQHTDANRLALLGIYTRQVDAASVSRLLNLAREIEDGPLLAEALRHLSTHPIAPVHEFVRTKLDCPVTAVRAAAVEAIGLLEDRQSIPVVHKLLNDPETRVRRSAAFSAGRLAIMEVVEPLLKLARDPDSHVRRECLEALRRLREPRVLPLAVAALQDGVCQLTALECIADLGSPEQLAALSSMKPFTPESTQALARTLVTWLKKEAPASPVSDRLKSAVAQLHGATGTLLGWHVHSMYIHPRFRGIERRVVSAEWQLAEGKDGVVSMTPPRAGEEHTYKFAVAQIAMPEPAEVQFLTSSGQSLEITVNDQTVFPVRRGNSLPAESDRFSAKLARGVNRITVASNSKEVAKFFLRFRHKSSDAAHERLTQQALTSAGDPQMGRELFMNAERSQCLKCHRLGDQGASVGPDLTGVGSRFTRIYLIESILDPGRAIAPGFETVMLQLKDGRMHSGVRISETTSTVVLGNLLDPLTQQTISKADIDKTIPMPVSVMPAGLEKSLTRQEFVDLIAFLETQK